MAFQVYKDQSQFYQTVTKVQEGDETLDLVTLPPGTLLFRAAHIPNTEEGDDVRRFYRDYLGGPEDIRKGGRVVVKQVCLTPTHNVFFYPFPFIGFGIHDLGTTFYANSVHAVVLVHPLTVICNVSPSEKTRGDAYMASPKSVYRRCDTFNYLCHPLTPREIQGRKYDNCIDPEYQQRSGTRGWMAIANLDSLNAKERGNELQRINGLAPMAYYARELDKKFPGQGKELLAWAYKDNKNHAGFPELALYPYKNHPGPHNVLRKCGSNTDAINLMVYEASRNNLNYLPLAVFTVDGVIDMVNGQFDFSCLEATTNTFGTNATINKSKIEDYVQKWMNHIETKGLGLPFYGHQKLRFDMRTGFFVFPQMLPRDNMFAVPKDPKYPKDPETIPYYHLTLPLENEEQRKHAIMYMLVFRNFDAARFLFRYGLAEHFGVRRAMIFNRPHPQEIKNLFKDIFGAKDDKNIPDLYRKALGQAGRIFAEEKISETDAMKVPMVDGYDLQTIINTTIPPFHPIQPNMFSLYNQTGVQQLQTSLIDIVSMNEEQYKTLLYDGMRKNVYNANAPSKRYIFSSAADVKKASKDVQVKLNYYFKFVPEAQRWKIQMDDVALFSVTEPNLARLQALHIKRVLYNLLGSSRMRDAVITDATACVGGNTIAFADYFYVNSVEYSPQRARMLANNILVTNKQNKVEVIGADYLSIMRTLKQDVVFMDPPWGGTDYKKDKRIDMFLGTTNVVDIVRTILNEGLAPIVAIKAPLNYNTFMYNNRKTFPGMNIEILRMPKMFLILVSYSKYEGFLSRLDLFRHSSKFKVGDSVRVKAGDLEGATGKVKQIDSNGAIVSLSQESKNAIGVNDDLLIPFDELELTSISPPYTTNAFQFTQPPSRWTTNPYNLTVYSSTTPTYGPTTPTYGPTTPTYGPTTPTYGPTTPTYAPTTPTYAPTSPIYTIQNPLLKNVTNSPIYNPRIEAGGYDTYSKAKMKSSDAPESIPPGSLYMISDKGSIIAERYGGGYTIRQVEVLPEFRGQGEGKYLLVEMLKYLIPKKLPIILYVDPNNKVAISLYKKVGFQLVKTGTTFGDKYQYVGNDYRIGQGGAKRKTRSKKYKNKRITRRAGKKDRYEPLKMFHKVWKAYVTNLK